MLPEEEARVKIDKQLKNAGWDIVSRNDYVPGIATAIKEALMQGNKESDYLLFIDNKAIAVVEAKREENNLGEDVEEQAEYYAKHPQSWYGLWFDKLVPLVYLANGKKLFFKNMLDPNSDYIELDKMHSPKKMLQIVGKNSEYGALPCLEKRGLRDCQYDAEIKFEENLREGKRKNLAILATGSGKTYLACLASYRLLNYTSTKRILFLVDRNNLARQTKAEFSAFDRTENRKSLSSLYRIERLHKESDIKADIVISTIQKLFAVLTGQKLSEENEDVEDERLAMDEDIESGEVIQLGEHLKLKPDHFQFIIVDECHRSIYGKWRAVLDYFSEAKVLGLTATPTEDTESYFDKNEIKKYDYDASVVDGVNVPARIYRIATRISLHGGTISKGEEVQETSKYNKTLSVYNSSTQIDYDPSQLDRSIINLNQIKEVLTSYRKAIYTDLYPEREQVWEYIPKTLIFAKDDNHATQIVNMTKEVFKNDFPDGEVPEHFVQKITYTAGDTDGLICDLREEKDFRIAVTVTLVATGTDVKPLEVVMFMKDVHSDVLYTQMKGRACRWIKDDKLKEVTPNANTKSCYYIVDAIGVTEHEKRIPKPSRSTNGGSRMLSLEHLLEHLSHNELSDENMLLLRDYCSSINMRYENNPLIERHLDYFIRTYDFAPRTIANNINEAFENGRLVEFVDPSGDNSMRMGLIYKLISNIPARKKLLEMQKGYYYTVSEEQDETLYAGFSKETAGSYIENFEKYLEENKDEIEALRIIYNSEHIAITHNMLIDLKERLLSENRQYNIYQIWKNYRIVDSDGNVEDIDMKKSVDVLTNLIQIVRYAYKKDYKLTSLLTGYRKSFSLYCGQEQRQLTDEQTEIMRQIAEYVVNDGAITVAELNEFDTDLWRRSITSFGVPMLTAEMQSLSEFILKVA